MVSTITNQDEMKPENTSIQKKIEKIKILESEYGQSYLDVEDEKGFRQLIVFKINELVDAVNLLNPKK
jgi:hypothetical protein